MIFFPHKIFRISVPQFFHVCRPGFGSFPLRFRVALQLFVNIYVLFVDIIRIVKLRRTPTPYVTVFRRRFRRTVESDIHIYHLEQSFRVSALFVHDVVKLHLLTIYYYVFAFGKRHFCGNPVGVVSDCRTERIFELPPRADHNAALIAENVRLHGVYRSRGNVFR